MWVSPLYFPSFIVVVFGDMFGLFYLEANVCGYFDVSLLYVLCKCNSNFQLPVPVMRDNYPDDKYLYEIIVETGPNDNHATTSTINFILSGNECDTEVRFVVCLFSVLDRRPKFYGRSQRFKTYGYGYGGPSLRPFLRLKVLLVVFLVFSKM